MVTGESTPKLGSDLGLSENDLADMKSWLSSEEDRALAVRLLDLRVSALLGGDPVNMAHWMRSANRGFDGDAPIDLIKTEQGYQAVMGYLEIFLRGYYPDFPVRD